MSTTKKTYYGVIYRNPSHTRGSWKDLSRSDLKRFIASNAFANLPICVRHQTRKDGQHETNPEIDQIAGRIVKAWDDPKTGTTFVAWQFGDDSFGRNAEDMVKRKVFTELSLSHVCHEGTKEVLGPREVSVCMTGARPGCVIVNAEHRTINPGGVKPAVHILPYTTTTTTTTKMSSSSSAQAAVMDADQAKMMQMFQAFLASQQEQKAPPPATPASTPTLEVEAKAQPPVVAMDSDTATARSIMDELTTLTKRTHTDMENADTLQQQLLEQQKVLQSLQAKNQQLEQSQRQIAKNRFDEVKSRIEKLAAGAKNQEKLHTHIKSLEDKMNSDPLGAMKEMDVLADCLKEASQHKKAKTETPPPAQTPPVAPPQQQANFASMAQQWAAMMQQGQKGPTPAATTTPAAAVTEPERPSYVAVNASADDRFTKFMGPLFAAMEREGVSDLIGFGNAKNKTGLWMGGKPPRAN